MLLIFGFILYGVGVLTGVFVGHKISTELNERTNYPAPNDEDRKKILDLAKKQEKLTNNDIEKVLGVSDSTAQRYAQKLVQSGELRQHGKTGRNVYYTKR
jgi:predicted HTH transcriptional regulator